LSIPAAFIDPILYTPSGSPPVTVAPILPSTALPLTPEKKANLAGSRGSVEVRDEMAWMTIWNGQVRSRIAKSATGRGREGGEKGKRKRKKKVGEGS
jgi:hypothetical protein